MRPAFSDAAMVTLDALAFWPSSHTMGNFSSAIFARHQVCASTATVPSFTRTASNSGAGIVRTIESGVARGDAIGNCVWPDLGNVSNHGGHVCEYWCRGDGGALQQRPVAGGDGLIVHERCRQRVARRQRNCRRSVVASGRPGGTSFCHAAQGIELIRHSHYFGGTAHGEPQNMDF